MKTQLTIVLIFLLFTARLFASVTTDAILDEYRAAGIVSFDSSAGANLWTRKFDDDRSCTSCHTDSLLVKGRHKRTGKVIEPMAPSINPKRLTKRKKIDKWLLRNCKWTLGRECTIQEKGNILLWLSQQ